MNDAELDLARRLVASPKWRWMAGMLAVRAEGGPWTELRFHTPNEWTISLEEVGSNEWTLPVNPDDSDYVYHTDYVPDIADPATQGCLIELMGDAFDRLHHVGRWYCIENTDGLETHEGDSRGEALARALLAAFGEERGG